MLSIILPEHPILSKRAEEVPFEEILSKKTQELIDELFSVAKGERSLGGNQVLVGLAAPQVGVGKRIILVDVGVGSGRPGFGELKAFINPEITWRSDEVEWGREGCYSVDSSVIGLVSRAKRIKYLALDRFGEKLEGELTGYTARVFQHEVDHLEGIRFPDRVGEKGVLQWVSEERHAEYRQNWQTWPHRYPWTSWLKVKATREENSAKRANN